MDWLTFISDMTANLAWPLVVVIGGIIFYKQISDLAARFKALLDDRVEEASIGQTGLSLRRKVDSDLKKAEKELPAPDTAKGKTASTWLAPFSEEIEELAAINPAAAIASASARLEAALRDVLKETGTNTKGRGLLQLLRECVQQGILTENEANAGKYLSSVRNEALHENVATVEQAQEFGHLALRIAAAARLGVGQTSTAGDPL
ncbi:hypothetical protein ACFVKB_39200 [Rhodococcus sp. NPDC127530]|uniref:hypothetical protein n=1 Tax=unclassified Rhodococcus (in: high G+C Gram-positive bacteria) TaxID=192944 RepID=UPI003628179A